MKFQDLIYVSRGWIYVKHKITNFCIFKAHWPFWLTVIRFIMNSIGGKTLSPDIIGTATISGAKLFLMKDLKLIYIFQDKLIIKFYFKVTKRNANLPFLSVNFPSVCSEITSQIVCKFLQIIVYKTDPTKICKKQIQLSNTYDKAHLVLHGSHQLIPFLP